MACLTQWTARLTAFGLERWGDVVLRLFEYLGAMCRAGPQRQAYEELKRGMQTRYVAHRDPCKDACDESHVPHRNICNPPSPAKLVKRVLNAMLRGASGNEALKSECDDCPVGTCEC